eukprot:954437-Pyramimonas_sp.AAC.1
MDAPNVHMDAPNVHIEGQPAPRPRECRGDRGTARAARPPANSPPPRVNSRARRSGKRPAGRRRARRL